MKEITLEAKKRTGTGKERAKKLRRKGLIPAVVYGPGDEPLPLEISAQSLNTILRAGKGENVIITLNIDDDQAQQKKVLIREIQHDPVAGDILHVDFYEVDLGKALRVSVPLRFVGRAAGIVDGGILQPLERDVEVECLPLEIPEAIEVDVSPLGIHDVMHVSALKFSGNVKPIFDSDYPVVTVLPPTVAEAPVAAAAAVEGAAAEAAPAEGAAPAAGAAAEGGAKEGAAPAGGGKKG
jgi:large subunit ribosomal protein L25